MNYQKLNIGDSFKIYHLNPECQNAFFSKNNDDFLGEKKDYLCRIIDKEGVVIYSNKEIVVEYCDGNYQYSSPVYFIEVFTNNNIIAKYLYYYLLANKDKLARVYRDCNNEIRLPVLSKFEICYPPITVQLDLVSILDGLYSLERNLVKSYQNSRLFPVAFYKRLEEASGFIWNKYKLSELAHLEFGNSNNSENLEAININPDSLVIGGKRKIILDSISTKCDLIVLACSLLSKPVFQHVSYSGDSYLLSLFKMKNQIIKVPSSAEQERIVEIFNKAKLIADNIKSMNSRLRIIKEYYLHYYLYRKNFGKHLEKNTKDIRKYSYLDSTLIDSLQMYDSLRMDLYKSLAVGDVYQYFDEITKTIKLKKENEDT